MSGPNACHRERMDVERSVEGRPERDDLFHELGLAVREHLGEHASAALAYERHARAGAVVQVLQSVEQRPQHNLRVRHVERDARHLRAVSDAPQPLVWGVQRPVAGETTRDQDDRTSQSWWDLDTPPNRIPY